MPPQLRIADGSSPDPEEGAPAAPPFLEPEIDSFLRGQCQEIARWTRSAGEAVRAEVGRAVAQGLSDAFRRLADELPRILAEASAGAITSTAVEPIAVEKAESQMAGSTPDAARLHLREARRRARSGDSRGAAASAAEALRLHPSYWQAFVVRGQAFCDLGELDRAAADFGEAVRHEPNLAGLHMLLGGVCLAQSHWQEAAAAYSDALRLDPGQATAFLNRGLARSKTGEADGAIADADEALHLQPDMAEAYYLRAVACTQLQKNDRAIADLTRLLALQPELWRAYYMRGMAHANQGDYDGATADFCQTLRLQPGFLNARFQRGVAYRLGAEPTLAIHDFNHYLREKPGSARARFQRGLAFLASKRWPEAVADFDGVLERRPMDSEARGRRDEAVRERDRELAAAAPAPAGAQAPVSLRSPDPPAPEPVIDPAGPTANILWLTCPECGVSGAVRWRRLNHVFKCRGCSRLFRVDGEGRFTEFYPKGRPRRRWPLKRMGAVVVCLMAVVAGWRWLHNQTSTEAPLPQDLKARAELWAKAWAADDHYTMRRLTDPVFDKALHPWLARHRLPALGAGLTDGRPAAEFEARVDRPGDHQAVLVLHLKSSAPNGSVEVRQTWVERGDSWYFEPS